MRGFDDRPRDGRADEEALLDAAAEAFEAGRFEEALARADEALAAAPRSVAALHTRAAALAELGRIEDARAAYERALSADRDDVELLRGAADFYVNVLPEDEADREHVERGLELARRGRKAARKAGDAELGAELAWLEGAALNQLGRSVEALERLAEAEREDPGRVDVLLETGFALYELCRFDEADRVLRRAEALAPDEPWTHHYLGLVAERRGDAEEARRRAARARKLAPQEFPKPIALSPEAFDAAVEDALADVPEQVRSYLANVAITIEELPSQDDLLSSDPPLSPAILGLFRGAPYGQKASMDPWSHFPSSIVLYQRNLERFARSRAELIEQIGITLIHEVGHFLGLNEDELYARGLE
ncbi:metallopeptidase family protein [Anaeromyxobacter oryzisoli]|uniref:metallopeptidase family protein n=1 Tax=Anaeromyxobacter oryzisoli TaxID=2925408 RepID=UPI001F59FF02|nr:metallopeptidase family protein [Anaeromyxobacter sp. SG63]